MLYDFLNTTSYYTRLPDQSTFKVQPNAMTGLAWCCRARPNTLQVLHSKREPLLIEIRPFGKKTLNSFSNAWGP